MKEIRSRKSEPYNFLRFQHRVDGFCILRGAKTSSEMDEEMHHLGTYQTLDEAKKVLQGLWMGDRLLTKIGDNYDQDKASED